MANILFICSRPPFPPTDGARVRMFNLAKELDKRHEVDVVSISQDDEYERPDRWFSAYQVFEEHPLRFYLRGIQSLFSSDPIQCRTHLSGEMNSWVEDHIDEYDLAFCTHLATVKYVESRDIPKVIDLVDAVSNNFDGFVSDAPLLWRPIYRIEAQRAKLYEKVVTETFDKCFITTESDRCHIPSDDIDVIANGVSADLLEYEQKTPANKDIVFLGDLSTIPNASAVKWFVQDIFPYIQTEVEGVSFTIVGKSPPREIRRLGKRENITVTGFVDDPYEYVHNSRVSVAPVQIGGGIQNKVIESMGLGTPVVTTQFGATGIDVHDGHHLLVRDDEKEFATAVVEVLDNRSLAEQLGENGRQLIRDQYTWESVGQTLNDKITDVLDNPGKRSVSKQ